MNVTGKQVPGGAGLDGKQEFTIRTTLDGVCNETSSDVGFF